ncbi:Ros/MucR family transcriptional regulator [Sphingomonas sp. RS6]
MDQSVHLAVQLTIAWLSNQNNRVTIDEVPAFLRSMYATIDSISNASEQSDAVAEADRPEEIQPAVSVRKSLASKDHILSLIDGKPYRTLRRHLSAHGLTPDEYRARYNLKPDYPMVAESYSERRRALAQEIGLGQRGRAAKSRPQASATSAPPKRQRSKKG